MAKSNTVPVWPIDSLVERIPQANDSHQLSEAKRLEGLWAGDFGDAYVDRNKAAGNVRGPFWEQMLAQFPARRVLEVGCNVGANLRWVSAAVPHGTYGIDINQKAVNQLRADHSEINAVVGPARELPFRDGWFDLTFTMGVLIHQPPQTLPLVMSEIVRCSRRFVLCGEYFADHATEVAYRGQTGALYKRDFGTLYQELFPNLTLRTQGFLSKDEGWDDVTYWVFEKTY